MAVIRASVVCPQALYKDGEVSSLVLVWKAEHATFELWIHFTLSAVEDVQHNIVILVPPEGVDLLGQLFRVDAGQEDLTPDEAGPHRLAAGCRTTGQVSYKLPVHSFTTALCFSSLFKQQTKKLNAPVFLWINFCPLNQINTSQFMESVCCLEKP